MQNDTLQFLFFDEDYEALKQKIEGIREQVRETQRLSAESVEQSSESWHDNYTFEEAQRQLKMLLNHLGGLSKTMEHARVVSRPSAVPPAVDLGTAVKYTNLTAGFTDDVVVGSYMVLDATLEESGYISYDTPLARILMGVKEGDVRTGELGGRHVELRVDEISLPSGS